MDLKYAGLTEGYVYELRQLPAGAVGKCPITGQQYVVGETSTTGTYVHLTRVTDGLTFNASFVTSFVLVSLPEDVRACGKQTVPVRYCVRDYTNGACVAAGSKEYCQTIKYDMIHNQGYDERRLRIEAL